MSDGSERQPRNRRAAMTVKRCRFTDHSGPLFSDEQLRIWHDIAARGVDVAFNSATMETLLDEVARLRADLAQRDATLVAITEAIGGLNDGESVVEAVRFMATEHTAWSAQVGAMDRPLADLAQARADLARERETYANLAEGSKSALYWQSRCESAEADLARVTVLRNRLAKKVEQCADWFGLNSLDYERKWGNAWVDVDDAVIAADLRFALGGLPEPIGSGEDGTCT